MFADNQDFFPTPQHLIEKMLDGIDLRKIITVLEPSAGKGDIIDYLKQKEQEYPLKFGDKSHFNIDCIEKDTTLQHILKGKQYRIVSDDFLNYHTMKDYHLIIMNPPFSNGCKHLLKALEMQEKYGGWVVSLLNAETLKNPCSNDRITLARLLEEYDADIQYIPYAFKDAERKTDIEVALVKVKLPSVEKHSFIWDNLKKSREQIEETTDYNKEYLAENDVFKAIVNQYEMETKAGIKLIEEYRALKPLILSEFEKDEKTGEIIQSGGSILSLDCSGGLLTINDYIKAVRRKYWKALFKNPAFIGQLTNNLQSQYYNQIEDLTEYDFSLYNIYQLKIDMLDNVVKGIEDTIVSLFEEFSHKHHWNDETSKNIHYYNGWKTNKSYIVNKKVIIPLSGFYDIEYSWGRFEPTQLRVINKLLDIEKCFNYLDGGLTETIDLKTSLEFAEEYKETRNIQLKYFTVSFYKKGTCHIVFNDDELLKKFNIFGSQHKGWLPPCYGKKTYQDMTPEEKAVINEFEGEEAYNKVMKNTNYYIFDRDSVKLLAE